MKRNALIIILLLIVVIYVYNNFFSKSLIIGTYVANNDNAVIDGPSKNDTLKLLENNIFKSTTWGNGKYSLEYSLSGTKINIQYKYQFGNAGYQMMVKRNYLIKPKLLFDIDQNYYFEKID